ncbi:hypothetical protein, partial [Klebsiella pneumoniae]
NPSVPTNNDLLDAPVTPRISVCGDGQGAGPLCSTHAHHRVGFTSPDTGLTVGCWQPEVHTDEIGKFS